MMPLAEQQKLPWCDCDFRATGEWSWCRNYDWCWGRKAKAIEAQSDKTACGLGPKDESAAPKEFARKKRGENQ
jgi:hypothetical protein